MSQTDWGKHVLEQTKAHSWQQWVDAAIPPVTGCNLRAGPAHPGSREYSFRLRVSRRRAANKAARVARRVRR